MQRVIVVQLSTFILSVVSAVICVVHPSSVSSSANSSDDSVGAPDVAPTIVSSSVGGKLDPLSAQISITISPLWSAIMVHLVSMQSNGIRRSPFIPVSMTFPPPSITNASVPFELFIWLWCTFSMLCPRVH